MSNLSKTVYALKLQPKDTAFVFMIQAHGDTVEASFNYPMQEWRVTFGIWVYGQSGNVGHKITDTHTLPIMHTGYVVNEESAIDAIKEVIRREDLKFSIL